MIKHASDKDFDDEVLAKKNLVIVDFYATWCMPCKMLAPNFESVSNEYKNVDFYKIDIDENPELVEKYGIVSVPTIVFIKDGEMINQEIGVRSEKELKEIITKLS